MTLWHVKVVSEKLKHVYAACRDVLALSRCVRVQTDRNRSKTVKWCMADVCINT